MSAYTDLFRYRQDLRRRLRKVTRNDPPEVREQLVKEIKELTVQLKKDA